MSFVIKGSVDGLGPVMLALNSIKLGVRNRAMRRALTKAGRLVTKAAKALAPFDVTTEGLTVKNLYKKSIIAKVNVKGDKAYCIVGPKNIKVQVGVRKRGGKKSRPGDPIYQNPGKIGHLLEFGHSRPPHPAPPHPHLRPAWDANKKKVVDVISEELWLELAKQGRKG